MLILRHTLMSQRSLCIKTSKMRRFCIKRSLRKSFCIMRSIADVLMAMYQYINDICYVCSNYICMLFMNMGQFINGHILINYLKKQVIQLYYNKYTHARVLQIIYTKKTLRKLHCQTISTFSTDSFPVMKACNSFLKSYSSNKHPLKTLVCRR
jgi:hypothetical protein